MPDADTLTFQFSTSLEWSSGVIRRLCHSPFSHVDYVTPDGLLGASDPGGVKIRPFNYQKFGTRRWAVVRTDKAARFHEIIRTEIGKPFDNDALWCFLGQMPTRDWRKPDRWFCSELITYALEESGFFPYKLVVAKDRVSPPDLLLLLNPYLDVMRFSQEITVP